MMLRADEGGQKPPAQRQAMIMIMIMIVIIIVIMIRNALIDINMPCLRIFIFVEGLRPNHISPSGSLARLCGRCNGVFFPIPASLPACNRVQLSCTRQCRQMGRAVLLLFDSYRFSLGQMQSVDYSRAVEVTIGTFKGY